MMVPDHRAGTTLRCPRCGVELRVPGTAPKMPASAAPLTAAADSSKVTADADNSRPPAGLTTDTTHKVPPVPLVAPAIEATEVAPPPVAALALTKSFPPATTGWLPPVHQATTAFYLALVLAALALFGISPAVWEWFELWRNPEQPQVPPWVFALLITGVLQLAYAVYLAQAPDWSAMWATTISTLAAAAAWAALLGTTLLGRDESVLVTLFRYADKLEGNRAAMWCFIMLCFTSVLAYFLGHTAVRWQRSYNLLRQVRGG